MNNQPTSDDPTALLAPKIVLYSSALLPWRGIDCEQRYHLAGEYSYPAFASHMLCLHLGRPSFVERIGDGQSQSGTMATGGLQLIPAGTACTWRHPSATGFITITLETSLVEQVAAELDCRHVELLPQFAIHDPRIEHICQALLAETKAGGSSGRLYGEGLGTALAAHLISSYSSTPRYLALPARGLPVPLLRRLLALIEDRLAEDLSLAELAQAADLSQSHFAALFRLSTGLAPHHYIVQRRVERARSLLQSTRLPLSEIATAAGFYDQSHLTRQMRRVLGVTPGYVRKQLSR